MKDKYIIDTDGIANPITIYINIIQNNIIVMCTNGFDQFSTTFWKPKSCTHDDPLTWLVGHLVIMEKDRDGVHDAEECVTDLNYLKTKCVAPNDWSCDECNKSFGIVAQKLKEWMGDDYKEFIRAPVIRSKDGATNRNPQY